MHNIRVGSEMRVEKEGVNYEEEWIRVWGKEKKEMKGEERLFKVIVLRKRGFWEDEEDGWREWRGGVAIGVEIKEMPVAGQRSKSMWMWEGQWEKERCKKAKRMSTCGVKCMQLRTNFT